MSVWRQYWIGVETPISSDWCCVSAITNQTTSVRLSGQTRKLNCLGIDDKHTRTPRFEGDENSNYSIEYPGWVRVDGMCQQYLCHGVITLWHPGTKYYTIYYQLNSEIHRDIMLQKSEAS
jgi:hypothetical protein